jgi:predicted dehydrogenase
MNAQPLRAAVIGLGVGEQHARAFAADEDAELTWLYDLDPSRTARIARDLGQGKVADGLPQILADRRTDALCIATYDDAHFGEVMAALDANKHVFCEKPLCRTIEEARQIKVALENSGRHLECNLVLRASPLYRWLKEAIGAGELGEIYAIDGEYLYGRIEKITEGWRKDTPDYSVMQGGAIHMIDLMLWLTGQRPTHVSAVGNRISSKDSAFRYNDFVAAQYEFPSTMVGRITANFGCVHEHHHVVRIYGTKATFLYDDQGPRLHTTRKPGEMPERITYDPLPASKGALIPHFIRAIRAGEAANSSAHELEVVAATTAADRALRAGARIEIDYP